MTIPHGTRRIRRATAASTAARPSSAASPRVLSRCAAALGLAATDRQGSEMVGCSREPPESPNVIETPLAEELTPLQEFLRSDRAPAAAMGLSELDGVLT